MVPLCSPFPVRARVHVVWINVSGLRRWLVRETMEGLDSRIKEVRLAPIVRPIACRYVVCQLLLI